MRFLYQPESQGITHFQLILPTGAGVLFKPGIPFLYSLILNRYGNRKLGRHFFDRLEERAIHLEIRPGREFLTIEVGALNSQLPDALSYLRELLEEPNFTEETFERGLQEREEIIRNQENNKDYLATKLLYKISFPGTPLAKPSTGELGDRYQLEELWEFHRQGVRTGGGYLLVVGKEVSPEEFNYLPIGTPPKIPHYTPIQRYATEEVESEQAYIHFLAPLHSNPKEEGYLRKIAFQILGAGGFGSRIMEEIRVKRGLAYSAYGFAEVRKITSLFKGHLQTKLETQQEAVEVLKGVIRRFLEKGVTEQEVEEAKKFLVGSEPLRRETPMQRLFIQFREEYFGLGKGYYHRELELIQQATAADVNRYIQRHPEIGKLSIATVTGRKLG
ncbi:MAG: pitrilysin family protein [Campylobacterales bacterium]